MMSDITMSLDDTLELDTIIEESTRASNPIGTVKYEGSDSTVHNSTGIQTNTYIFDPQESGKYTIPVNGQELTVNVTKSSAIPDSEVDQFKDGDVGEYQTFNLKTWSATSSAAFNGSYGGELTNSTGGASSAISTTGLPNYPQRNRQFWWHHSMQTDGPNFAVGFCLQSDSEDLPDGYYIHYSYDGEEINLIKKNSGTETTLDTVSRTLSTTTWRKTHVTEFSSGGSITIEFQDASENKLETLSASDTTFSSGGIGWTFAFGGTSGGDTVYVDDFLTE